MKPIFLYQKPETESLTEWNKIIPWLLTWKKGIFLILWRMKEVKKNIDIYEKKLRELESNLEDKKTE